MKLLGTMVMTAGALTACGGGSDPTPYGSVAWDASRPSAAITINYVTQEQANSAALERCGGGACAVVLEFSGKGACGAIAVGSGASLVAGVGKGASQADAESAAVADCGAKGGGSCSIPSSLPGKCM
ncbi:DUF4189 domain-containing protein [Hydrogenophaga sp. MI9]|uniref:DUF4189 domain-containing protein n=1 Tax=Hydrogenophaga sp. MI9 TaxID=3453719 RepID=UPI003EECD9E0